MKAVQLFSQIKKKFQTEEIKVQTTLVDESYYPGELIQGRVRIESLHTEQRVDSLYLKIFTQFEKKMNGHQIMVTYPIAKYKLRQTILVPEGKEQVLPFTIQLPYLAPLSVGQAKVWLQTELDLSNRNDPTHQTDITVTPTPIFQSFMRVCNEMGFRLVGSVCTNQAIAQKFDLPFIQTFALAHVQEKNAYMVGKFEVSIFQVTDEACSCYVQWYKGETLSYEESIVFSVKEMSRWKVHLKDMCGEQ